MEAMGMSQTSVSPAEGPHEPSLGAAYDDGSRDFRRDEPQLNEGTDATLDGAARKDDDLPEERYLDREESWLRFNERVVELAEDESVPLLERVRFLAIFATNLDEFFMVRVASLVRRMVAGFPVEGLGVRMPRQVLENTLELAGGAARSAGWWPASRVRASGSGCPGRCRRTPWSWAASSLAGTRGSSTSG